jgi:hypothetical protein
MTALLDPAALDKLAKVCGLFSSAHEGERASAAALADKMVRASGLTWADLIAPRFPVEQQIGVALAGRDALSRWERGFLYSINGKRTLTPKQRDLLDGIAAKARAYRESCR